MFESEEQRKRAELIITLLAKLYVVLELSVDNCPVCHKALSHDSECPISLAWSLLSEDQQRDARAAIRALALSIGTDESLGDPMVH
jgi:predicted nucleic acid-binding Zn ribbon protein